jgi:ribosome-binding factor A
MDELFKKESGKSKRLARVAAQIQEEVAALLIKGLKDPRLEGVNITAVKVSDDLRYARIYYNILGGERGRGRGIAAAFESANGFIRRALGKTLALRILPELTFFYDDTLDKAERIEKILNEALHPRRPDQDEQ